MKFEPCNRYLLIERTEKKGKESLIALPDDFKTEEKYEKATILSIAPDVRPPISPGQQVVILSHMVEEVDFGEGKVYLVLENHVVGILKEKF
jgi:co-chaperonin GroES (HSP10)